MNLSRQSVPTHHLYQHIMWGELYYASIKDLRDVLIHLPADDSDLTICNNLALINCWGTCSFINHIIEKIVADKILLEAVSSMSYRHINGFDKIVLLADRGVNGYRLTLHIWENELRENEAPELIHDHRFDLWSKVLVGTLESENYIKSTDGTKYRNYRYIPEKRGKAFVDFYKYEGDAYLTRVEKTKLSVGASYHLSNKSIHQVIKQRSCVTCTLVLRGPRKKAYANVYNNRYPKTDNKFSNLMFSPQEVKTKLQSMMDEWRT